jgi:hypothetical protein
MEQVRTLWHLQQIDLVLDEKQAQYRQAQRQLGESEELLAVRQEAKVKAEKLKDLQSKLHLGELELEGLEDKIADVTDQLYGGRVTNPKELAALQQDIEYLQRRQSELEDEVLGLMTEIDELEPDLEATRQELAQIRKAWDSEQAKLEALLEKLEVDIQSHRKERQGIAETIPSRDMQLYKNIRHQKGGQAVTRLKGRLCGICRVAVPSGKVQQVRGQDQIVTCDSCGRILYVE